MMGKQSEKCKSRGGCAWEYKQVRCVVCGGLRCVMHCTRRGCEIEDWTCINE